MTEGQASSPPRFCRQCGASVPENTTDCPRCGKKWYLDSVEERGIDLWQKIIQKRAAAGLGDAAQAEEQQKQYRCPSCMAVLKTPLPVCPHCGKSTVRARIIPTKEDIPAQDTETEKPLDLSDAARGLAAIKGATKRAKKFRARRRLKALDIIIIVAIIIVLAGVGFLVARQYGWLPPQLSFLKPAEPVQQTQPTTVAITNISTSPDGTNKAVITWSTDTSVTCKVLYGKTANYGMLAQTDGKSARQSISLASLEPATTYHFAIIAVDGKGKEIARSQDSIFTTPSERDTIPPAISQYKVISTDIGAFIQWVTDEPSTSQVLYGINESCDKSTTIDPKQVTSHTVRLTGLEPNTTYYYRVKSVDPAGNEAVMNPPNAFTTLITVPMGSRIGDRAPDFTLPLFKSLDTVNLRNYKGQKVLITFWAVYCPDCDRELSLIQSLKNKNLPGVVLLAVFLESKPDDIDKIVTRFKSEGNELTVPILVDMYKTTAHLYSVEKLPITFFIDGDRIIREIEYGSFNIDQFEKILNSL